MTADETLFGLMAVAEEQQKMASDSIARLDRVVEVTGKLIEHSIVEVRRAAERESRDALVGLISEFYRLAEEVEQTRQGLEYFTQEKIQKQNRLIWGLVILYVITGLGLLGFFVVSS